MQSPDRTIARGILALGIIIALYLVWPYVVLFLSIVGAAQVYRVWRNRIGR
jgi:hypothetical protein